MLLSELDVHLMVCMYDEDRIGTHHGNVENILRFCTPKEYRDRHPVGKLRKRMRQLADMGFLLRKSGRFEAFSLTPRGVRVAERRKAGWTLEQINDAEERTI